MKPFVLFFGEFSQNLDPARHTVGEFATVRDAQFAAERLKRHHRGNWAYIALGNALSVVRAGMHSGETGQYGWEWDDVSTAQ